ncbi:MAG: hypothetical protein ACLSG9_01880 [Eubacterium sp.]
MTLFQRAGKAAGNAIKSIGVAIGSMAATWAIGEVLSLVFTGIDSLLNQASNISEKAEVLRVQWTHSTLLLKKALLRLMIWQTILGDSDYWDSKEANIVENALDIDVDKLDEYTDDQLSQLLKTKIDNFQNQLDTKANNIAKGVSAMLVSDDDFDSLDESLQNNIC